MTIEVFANLDPEQLPILPAELKVLTCTKECLNTIWQIIVAGDVEGGVALLVALVQKVQRLFRTNFLKS